MKFGKYHALGNDYLVVPGLPQPPAGLVRRICDRHYGIGSDGLLAGPQPSTRADFGLRIFNPDGGEAEKSGNGLRIFCRYLWDEGLVGAAPFTVETAGGIVNAQVLDNGRRVRVEMGRVSFSSIDIPVAGAPREVIMEQLEAGGCGFVFCAATIGNPHCVVPVVHATAELAREFGPALEVHPLFPNRTNVQFMQVLDRNAIRIEIWERGAGYTLASGSSSCAAASVAHRLGLCDRQITVHMAGGQIQIELDEHFNVIMTGPVVRICAGEMADEALD